MQLLPFYMVCDESGSMAGEPIDSINDSLPDLHREISRSPALSDKTRFGLVGFSEDARVLLPLSDLSDLESIPGLQAEDMTNFGAVFRLLRGCIESDVRRLKDEGHTVFRPVVFFLSDGLPTDSGWEAAHTELLSPDFPARPHIIAFGIGDCDAETIRKVATFTAFIQQDDSVSPAKALREFATAMTKSMVQSVRHSPGDRAGLVVPDTVPGFKVLSLDVM